MTIYKDDIKLFESKVMTDESDGGGEMTGVEIVSGQHNSIVPDISDLDRAYGVVNIRSVHVKVNSDDDDTYYGATVGLIETPQDENVDITLMSVNDPYIERDETKNIIEQYLTKGAKYQGELLYTQLKGQRAIRFIQKTNISQPTTGDVLVLSSSITGEEQYVKIEEASSASQTFTHTNDTQFTRSVVTCIITEPLRYDFGGVNPSPYDPTSSSSSVYESMVADASKYYGLKDLAADAYFNKSELMVDSIYTQLVPSTRVDNAHVNQDAVNLVAAKFDMGDGTEGELLTGVESKKIDVTVNNQGYVYVATLVPIPSKGTTKVSFMAQNNWYELQDDGTGVLKGSDDSYGTGQIDEFGNLSITLGALPDVEVPILVQYQNVNNYVKKIPSSDLTIENTFTIPLGQTPVNSELSEITWSNKSATLVDGIITGDMTGKYLTDGTIYWLEVEFSEIPSSTTEFSISWDEQLNPTETTQKTLFRYVRNIQEGNILNLPANLPEGALKLTVTYQCSDVSVTEFQSSSSPDNPNPPSVKDYPNYKSRTVELLDDGNGNLIAQVGSYPIAGSINYGSGVVTLQPISIPFEKINYIIEQTGIAGSPSTNWAVYSIRVQSIVEETLLSGDFEIGEEVSCVGYETEITPPALEILAGELTCNFNSGYPVEINISTATEILEGTLAFTYNGLTYESTDGSNIYSGGDKVGTIDLATGEGNIYTWLAGNGEIQLTRGVSKTGLVPETQYSIFRTAGNPVASQSLQVNAVNFDDGNINATTDADGYISSPTSDFEGYIDTTTGIVELSASGLLDTSSIKYNCVSYNYLPLDSEQLGLDSIRLPSDGRVVIFEKGDVIVIHQDESISSQAVIAGETLQLPHVRLAECETTAGDAVIDLDAGTIEFPTAGTYDIDYRIEDMALLTYVDISGLLKTSRPLSHDYDMDKAKVASVLIAGDMFARYTNLFDQSTWTGTFNDNLIGTEASAEYNDTLYPITVTNEGCITERFAIVFTSSTNFKLIGEHVGQIATGDINNDFAPNNPASGKPYFTINKLGWGTGWSTNNVLRIDFYGAVYQLNVIRTILQGDSESSIDSDKFGLQIRGNVNQDT